MYSSTFINNSDPSSIYLHALFPLSSPKPRTYAKLRLIVMNICMESLLCDEVLVLSPLSPASPPAAAVVEKSNAVEQRRPSLVSSRNEFEEGFEFLMEKEMSYMPKPGYVNHLQSNTLIYHARCKAISWIIEAQKRLGVSMETAFYAANYFDRFISLNKCQEWKYCKFDLLSVACLSVASKFNETHPPSLHALQMEELLGHPPFGSNLIGCMEKSLLQALEWKLLSTTTYSYLQLMETLQDDELMKRRATQMLLQTLLDPKFLEFRPSLVAEAAFRCTLQENHDNQCFHHFSALIPQDQKVDMAKKIHELAEEGVIWEKKEERLCCREVGDCPVLSLQLEATDFNIIGAPTRKRKLEG